MKKLLEEVTTSFTPLDLRERNYICILNLYRIVIKEFEIFRIYVQQLLEENNHIVETSFKNLSLAWLMMTKGELKGHKENVGI